MAITEATERPDSAGTPKQAQALNVPLVYVHIGAATGHELGIQKYVRGGMVDLSVNKIAYAELFIQNLNVQLVDDLVWREGQLMRLFLGYAGVPDSIIHQGRFTMTRPKFEFGGRNMISIGGFGEGIEMTRIAKRRVYENISYYRIVQTIASNYGLESLIDPGLNDTVPSVTQAGVTDYQFLKEIALRSGTDFFVANGRLYFMAQSLRKDEPVITIDARESGCHEAVFQIEGEGRAAVLLSSPVNPLTGKFEDVSSTYHPDGLFDVEASPSQVRFTQMARPRLTYVDGRGNQLTKSALQTLLDSDANRLKNIVKVRATVDGSARIAPRQVVVFLSVGGRFYGPYYITDVRHLIRGQTYTTTFEAVRATTGPYRQARVDKNLKPVGGTPQPMRDVSNLSVVNP